MYYYSGTTDDIHIERDHRTLQYERFFRAGETVVMSTYAPITFPPAPVLVFQVDTVLPSSSQLEKLVPYILLPTIVVIGLQKPCTKREVGAGLELIDVYWRLAV
jgi:hypothetical protein